MRRRELITDQDVWDWFRLVEIPPYWRDNLIKLIWEVPTRVDIRRFLDMGTIDETRLREYYGQLGYHGKALDDYVLWTKVYNAVPDLIARSKNGWMNSGEIVAELAKLGMTEEAATNLYQTKIKNPAADVSLNEAKSLTKAEIYKGVKQGIISQGEAFSLIMELGYDEWEAEYLVVTNTKATSSPETPLDYLELTNAYRKMKGLSVKEIPNDLLNAERAYFNAKKRLVIGQGENLDPEKLETLEADVYKLEAVYSVLRKQYGFE